MKTKEKILLVLSTIVFMATACNKEKPLDNTTDEIKVQGFSFFNKIIGMWNGPVTSATPAGNFDNWYVDYRPVSASQVSHFSLLDTNTVNNMSFFTVKRNGNIKLAMRTEGCFNNQCCITYEVLDSVCETTGYYRFSDFKAGVARAYTEFIFTNNNEELTMKVYTNKFNTVAPLELHSLWAAQLASRNYTTDAISFFNYPQPVITKDFSTAFSYMSESILYTFDNDPYPTSEQPYVGNVIVNINIDPTLPTSNSDIVFVLFTTASLFDGNTYKPANLKYISKYVYLSVETSSFLIKNVHPGQYFLYAFVDKNNDYHYLSGDYMCSDLSKTFTVTAEQNIQVDAVIDFVIP